MDIKKYIKNYFWVICWLAVLIAFSLSALVSTDGPPLGESEILDKVAHLLVFLFLTAVPLAFFSNRKWAFLCVGAMPIIGFGLEYMQQSIGGRQFSPEDMIANNIGVILGVASGILIRVVLRIRRQRQGGE